MKFMKKMPLYFYMWGGMTLGALFFYPIAMTLGEQNYFLHWRFTNTMELSVCWFLIAMAFALAWWGVDQIKNDAARFVLMSSLVFLPLISFFTHFVRALDLKDFLVRISLINNEHGQPYLDISNTTLALILVSTGVLCCVVTGIRTLLRGERNLIIILSPITLVVLFNITARFGWDEVIGFQRPEMMSVQQAGDVTPYSVFVLLFDEMSYEYLYKDGAIRPEFPKIRAFADLSDNYHEALAPGGNTKISIPGYLRGNRVNRVKIKRNRLFTEDADGAIEELVLDGNNIFARAREKGYRTELIGWYHSYCELLKTSLDVCRAFSMLNAGATNRSFSLVNPILTNIIIWPYRFPFGLLKNPIYARHHRDVALETFDLGVAALDSPGPLLQFIHFSIPHEPYIFDGNRFKVSQSPFLSSSDNYVKQLKFVDNVFGRWLHELKSRKRFANSMVVVLSDHNFRDMAKKHGWNRKHIPLLIKRVNQKVKRDLRDPVQAETVLLEIVKGLKPL